MSADKKDFYGKEVTGAIKKACEELGVPQERLEIDVIQTGSTGIFGLIRKKAHIRVIVKIELEDEVEEIFNIENLAVKKEIIQKKEKPVKSKKAKKEVVEKAVAKEAPKQLKEEEKPQEVVEDLSDETVEIVKNDLLQMVDLMGFPSTVEVDVKGAVVNCTIRGDFDENLTGPEGKTLDSLQYLLRKTVSRKATERVKISVDVGDFRARRQEDLKNRAVELANLVKKDGKTQVIPALNPSERRAIHMILQDDKEIRSRSVGDGLFKKILIYKPGKGNRGPRKKGAPRGRRGNKSGQNTKDSQE